MKKTSTFHPSGPLLTAEGDFPLDNINSKDLYEESPKLPTNKLDVLKRKKQKSIELKVNKSLQQVPGIQEQQTKLESFLNENTSHDFEENIETFLEKPLFALAESFDIGMEQVSDLFF